MATFSAGGIPIPAKKPTQSFGFGGMLDKAIPYLGPISSAISIGTSLFGSKKKPPSVATQAKDAAHIQGELQKDQWAVNMAAAKQYGIHPLAALGISPNATPIPQYDTGSIKGQNLGRAAGAAIAGYKNKQLEALQLERAGLENDLLRSQISNINSQAGDSPNPQGYNPNAANPNDAGLSKDTPPAFIRFNIGRGKTVELVNPDIAEILEGMPAPAAYAKMTQLYGQRTAVRIMDALDKKAPRPKKKSPPTKPIYKGITAKRRHDGSIENLL